MAKSLNTHQRLDRETMAMVNWIKAEHLRRGKQPPSTAQIIRKVTNKIKKEELLRDEFIRF